MCASRAFCLATSMSPSPTREARFPNCGTRSPLNTSDLASGNWSKMATDITIARIAQAGAVPIDTYAVLAELMSTWNRPDAMEFAQVMVDHIVPPYRALSRDVGPNQATWTRNEDRSALRSKTSLMRMGTATG